MNEQEITELITRVLANEASADEKLRLEQWRKEHADNEIQFEQTRLIWDNAALFKEEVDTDAAWEKFSARLKASKKTISLKYYLQIAAAVILIAGLGYIGTTFILGSTQSVQTASTEVKQVTLPDGSIAWLNHDSKLEYDKDFKGKTRNIRLNGEAFFEVVKNPEKPFVITSAHSVTTVLGTSFNLTAYDSTENVDLTVATGKVSFVSVNTHNEVIVKANEAATIMTRGEAVKTGEANMNEIAWQSKKLVFNDTPLPDVFKSLEHYFNVKITVTNPDISKCPFTGTYNNPTLEKVMDDISKALGLTYELKGRKVTVSGKGCK
jgi:transmembrane sensor